MKKKQVNVAEEFSKIGEKIIGEFAKGIEEARNERSPFDNMFSEIKNDQLNQVYEGYKTVGEMLFNMKEGLVAAGFTEGQAMDIVIHEYLEQRAEAKG
ncbi:hypothetical protein [Bacillus pacificus]|uniref:hypothetical protein n=1 Tax=Bacillus pacificus TaxID=2026187 RepID=UPI001D0E6538|nr:hypothetical protein [Bacillus pacificus]MCC2352026.1 hypothetical protein [Bacillus pacificus]MCU5247369.1 hypothetical protein [Bacillus pacificus]MCU5467475.1 hypothetical protein [Bacillus pacificus]